MIITNNRELKNAYILLRFFKELKPDKLDALKRDIRQYYKTQNKRNRLVRDNGIDGFVELIEMPRHTDDCSETEIENIFNEYFKIDFVNSPYDCSGRPFTSWFKPCKRNGKWFIYHSVCFDV